MINKVFHPLSGASYTFKDNYLNYVISNLNKKEIRLSVGFQPNGIPHVGTICLISLSFSLAQKLVEKGIKVIIYFEYVDTASFSTKKYDGVVYQKSLRSETKINHIITDYLEIFNFYSELSGISYKVRGQAEFNKENKDIYRTLKYLIKNENKFVSYLDLNYNKLRIRVSCPQCGLTDKNSIKTSIYGTTISSVCPKHGSFKYNIKKDIQNLELNTPFRNLVRALVYTKDNNNPNVNYEWIKITGMDYSGFFQEHQLYRIISRLNVKAHNLLMILYCPLICDWSGAKLSKSINLADGYGQDNIINYSDLKQRYGDDGLKKIFLLTNIWIEEPYMLFRNYTIDFFQTFLTMNDKTAIKKYLKGAK